MANSCMYIVPSRKYFDNIVSVLRTESKGKDIIYVTTNTPYSKIIETCAQRKIKTSDILFIDCISKQYETTGREPDNCIFLEGPEQITGLCIAINCAVKQMKNKKLLLIDSLSSLLMYNNDNVIGKFSNFLINKMNAQKVSVALFLLNSDVDKNIVKNIESFVDEVKNGT